MAGVKSPHTERKKHRRARLVKVIKEEGAELINATIKERFPWASITLIQKIRREVGVPAPRSEYLAREEVHALGDPPTIGFGRMK